MGLQLILPNRHHYDKKGAFERLKAKQGIWHPFFLWQLLGMFCITFSKINVTALGRGIYTVPSHPFSRILSKAGRGVCIRQSLQAWVDLQLPIHQMTSCVSGHNRTTANFFIYSQHISCLWSKSFWEGNQSSDSATGQIQQDNNNETWSWGIP